MNKITATSLGVSNSTFKSILKYMFDDCIEVDSKYYKHSACNVKLLAELDFDLAIDLTQRFGLHVSAVNLVGNWIVECVSDYSWGIDWCLISEAVKVEKVTETIIVTNWKPIENETETNVSSEQPRCKVCLPEK